MTSVKLSGFSAAFAYRNFRYLWVATLFSTAGRWTEAIVLSWLVLQMTGSPLLTGMVIACRWLGYGLGPVFGALADSYDRKKLLLIIASTSIAYSLSLAILITTENVRYWQTIIIALTASMAHGFDLPLRYALTGDMVDKSDIPNAVALNTVALDLTAIFGPAVAGPLIDVIGIGGVCWMLTVNYIFNITVIYQIQGLSSTRMMTPGSLWRNIVEGAKYIKGNPPVLALLLIAAAFNHFQFPLKNVLVPVLADGILRVGASGYGMLLATAGMGALAGAATIATLGNYPYKARLCIGASTLVAVAASLFSNSTIYPLSLGLICCVGMMEAIGMTTSSGLLMMLTPREMQGRVMGMRSLAILPLSTGSLLTGALAEAYGAPAAGMINAGLQFFSVLVITLSIPSLRRSG